MKLVLSPRALKDLKKIDISTSRRIVDKLQFFARQTEPLQFAESLVNNDFGSFRFRIGDYRVLCEADRTTIHVLRVGHRREIYR